MPELPPRARKPKSGSAKSKRRSVKNTEQSDIAPTAVAANRPAKQANLSERRGPKVEDAPQKKTHKKKRRKEDSKLAVVSSEPSQGLKRQDLSLDVDLSRTEMKKTTKRKHVETNDSSAPLDRGDSNNQRMRKRKKLNEGSSRDEAIAVHGQGSLAEEAVSSGEVADNSQVVVAKISVKKKGKDGKKGAEGKPTVRREQEEEEQNGAGASAEEGITENVQSVDEGAGRPERFIVFVGNLPFTTTVEAIAKHFKKIEPTEIRHMTDKGAGRSKGFAFLEFDRYDRMKTCLSRYHHTLFDDGSSPARKINVELTAGGGGSKSESRKAKLKAKNDKLNEERKRRFREQNKQNTGMAELAGDDGQLERQDDHVGMHPSRRARLGY